MGNTPLGRCENKISGYRNVSGDGSGQAGGGGGGFISPKGRSEEFGAQQKEREGRCRIRAHGGLPAAERNLIRGLVPKSPDWAASFDRRKAKFTIEKADAAKTPGN